MHLAGKGGRLQTPAAACSASSVCSCHLLSGSSCTESDRVLPWKVETGSRGWAFDHVLYWVGEKAMRGLEGSEVGAAYGRRIPRSG
jgi:hypothetical protein